MINCQIRDLSEIKLKGCVLWYTFDKWICKLKKDGGLNGKRETLIQIPYDNKLSSRRRHSPFCLSWESSEYGFVGEEPIFGLISLNFLILLVQVK